MSNKNNIDWIKSIPSNPLFGGADLINNNFSCYIGSVLAFYLGQGRVTNIYGSETKIVFDWVYMLTQLPMDWKGVLLPIAGLATIYRPYGSGGDSTFVLGPTNKLNYFGTDITVGRNRATIKVVYKKADDELKTIPSVVKFIIILGFVGILATVLTLRARYKMVSVSTSQTGMLASLLIPWFEGLWMALLFDVETAGGIGTILTKKVDWLVENVKAVANHLCNLLSIEGGDGVQAVAVPTAGTIMINGLKSAYGVCTDIGQGVSNLKEDTRRAFADLCDF